MVRVGYLRPGWIRKEMWWGGQDQSVLHLGFEEPRASGG